MPGGTEIFEFAFGEIIERIIQDCLSVFFPGPVSTAYGIFDFISTFFDVVGLINRVIEYIRYSHTIAGVLLGVFQLCIIAILPVLFIVILFNVVVRLVRRFIEA